MSPPPPPNHTQVDISAPFPKRSDVFSLRPNRGAKFTPGKVNGRQSYINNSSLSPGLLPIVHLKILLVRHKTHFNHVSCWSLIASEKDNILSILFGVPEWMAKQKRAKLSETWKAWFVRTPAVWKEIKAQRETLKQPSALHWNMACGSCSGHWLTTQVCLRPALPAESWERATSPLPSLYQRQPRRRCRLHPSQCTNSQCADSAQA